MKVPGKGPGNSATYTKVINPGGKTVKVYKDSYKHWNFTHRTVYYPKPLKATGWHDKLG